MSSTRAGVSSSGTPHSRSLHSRLHASIGSSTHGGSRLRHGGAERDLGLGSGKVLRPVLRDLIVVIEFSEAVGPVPVITLPSTAHKLLDLARFGVRVMVADFRKKKRRGALPSVNSADMCQVFEDCQNSLSVFCYYTALADFGARGYSRAICMCYLSPTPGKVQAAFGQLKQEFSALALLLRHSAQSVYVNEVKSVIGRLSALCGDAAVRCCKTHSHLTQSHSLSHSQTADHRPHGHDQSDSAMQSESSPKSEMHMHATVEGVDFMEETDSGFGSGTRLSRGKCGRRTMSSGMADGLSDDLSAAHSHASSSRQLLDTGSAESGKMSATATELKQLKEYEYSDLFQEVLSPEKIDDILEDMKEIGAAFSEPLAEIKFNSPLASKWHSRLSTLSSPAAASETVEGSAQRRMRYRPNRMGKEGYRPFEQIVGAEDFALMSSHLKAIRSKFGRNALDRHLEELTHSLKAYHRAAAELRLKHGDAATDLTLELELGAVGDDHSDFVIDSDTDVDCDCDSEMLLPSKCKAVDCHSHSGTRTGSVLSPRDCDESVERVKANGSKDENEMVAGSSMFCVGDLAFIDLMPRTHTLATANNCILPCTTMPNSDTVSVVGRSNNDHLSPPPPTSMSLPKTTTLSVIPSSDEIEVAATQQVEDDTVDELIAMAGPCKDLTVAESKYEADAIEEGGAVLLSVEQQCDAKNGDSDKEAISSRRITRSLSLDQMYESTPTVILEKSATTDEKRVVSGGQLLEPTVACGIGSVRERGYYWKYRGTHTTASIAHRRKPHAYLHSPHLSGRRPVVGTGTRRMRSVSLGGISSMTERIGSGTAAMARRIHAHTGTSPCIGPLRIAATGGLSAVPLVGLRDVIGASAKKKKAMAVSTMTEKKTAAVKTQSSGSGTGARNLPSTIVPLAMHSKHAMPSSKHTATASVPVHLLLQNAASDSSTHFSDALSSSFIATPKTKRRSVVVADNLHLKVRSDFLCERSKLEIEVKPGTGKYAAQCFAAAATGAPPIVSISSFVPGAADTKSAVPSSKRRVATGSRQCSYSIDILDGSRVVSCSSIVEDSDKGHLLKEAVIIEGEVFAERSPSPMRTKAISADGIVLKKATLPTTVTLTTAASGELVFGLETDTLDSGLAASCRVCDSCLETEKSALAIGRSLHARRRAFGRKLRRMQPVRERRNVERNVYSHLQSVFEGFAESVLYNLASGRPLVVVSLDECKARNAVSALSAAMPRRYRGCVQQWRTRPLKMADLIDLRLTAMPTALCKHCCDEVWQWVTLVELDRARMYGAVYTSPTKQLSGDHSADALLKVAVYPKTRFVTSALFWAWLSRIFTQMASNAAVFYWLRPAQTVGSCELRLRQWLGAAVADCGFHCQCDVDIAKHWALLFQDTLNCLTSGCQVAVCRSPQTAHSTQTRRQLLRAAMRRRVPPARVAFLSKVSRPKPKPKRESKKQTEDKHRKTSSTSSWKFWRSSRK